MAKNQGRRRSCKTGDRRTAALTTKVTREIEDPAQQEPQAEPEVAARIPGLNVIPTPAPEPRRRRTMVIPDFEQTYDSP